MTDPIPQFDAILALCAKYNLPVSGVTLTVRRGKQVVQYAVETVPVDEPDQTHPERMN